LKRVRGLELRLRDGVSLNFLTGKSQKKAKVEATRRSAVKFNDAQKYEKARVEVERRSVVKLTIEQR